jgi:hypothetical protein
VEFVVRAIREVGWEGLSVDTARTPLTNMGQTLFEPPDVSGWELGRGWFSTGAMLARMNFAATLAANQKFNLARAAAPYRSSPENVLDFFLDRLSPSPFELDPVFGQRPLVANRSTHYSGGIEQQVIGNAELAVEGFYKELDRLVVQDFRNGGSGFVYGTETLLRWKDDPKMFGWLAYTVSRSERRDGPGEDRHLAPYDQTHVLTLLLSRVIGDGLRFGGRFRFVSGQVYALTDRELRNVRVKEGPSIEHPNVVWTGSGFVAAGPRIAVWITPDGTIAPSSLPSFLYDRPENALAAAGDGTALLVYSVPTRTIRVALYGRFLAPRRRAAAHPE